ncbi:hypothetical protein RSAG8_12890, partial [Rhizoctonia solani AG-8 WAC10335]
MALESESELRYGPKLEEYFYSRDFNVFRHEPPSRDDILHAIDLLHHPQDVSYSTFETILSLERVPTWKNLDLLVSESAEGAFSACLQLLLQYCGGGERQLLDHAYGFLCLRVLALLIHYAMLIQTGQLGNIIDLVSNSCTGDSILSAFSGHTWRIIRDLIACAKNDDIWLFGWYDDPTTNQRICLPQIGGCIATDAIILLRLFSHNQPTDMFASNRRMHCH